MVRGCNSKYNSTIFNWPNLVFTHWLHGISKLEYRYENYNYYNLVNPDNF